jgi:ketosteroid isomerase-like protein
MTRRALLGVITLFVVTATGIQGQTAVEKEFAKIENDWGMAWMKKDSAALQSLYATEYIATDWEGVTTNKSQDIANAMAPDSKTQSFVVSDLKVRAYGDVAVVTGLNTIKATFKGADVSGAYRFTDVFVKRDGRWQAVATQGTKVVKK